MQQQPIVLYAADDKPSQGIITVHEVVNTPAIQLALANMHRWTEPIRTGVANVLSNRTSFVHTGATAAEIQLFDQLINNVERCMKQDSRFAEQMDPCYVIVDFGGPVAPAGYRGWLDQINANIGGADVGAAGSGNFNVTSASANNQPIRLMDPNLNHTNMLHVNTRHNADHVAGQLLILGGLSSWVLETKMPPNYH